MSKKKVSKKTEDIEMVTKTEFDELDARYKRVLADYDNLTRRCENERENLIKLSNQALISKLIVVLDDLTEALKHIEDPGLKSIKDKFSEILESEGLEEIAVDGILFDPNIHEAIETKDGPENQIISVLRKGYKLGDKVIRPALVSVGNGK